MNKFTNLDTDDDRSELLLARLSLRIVKALSELESLQARHDINERLRFAREQALARARQSRRAAAAPADFESKLVVKQDAPRLLRQAFEKPSWQGELIVFFGNTDCYQPLEAAYGLTRACLSICAEYRNPVGIITKGALVLRDLDVLDRLHREAWVRVYFSIPFSSDGMARKVEPHAPSITKRFEAMKVMADAGIATGISIAPVTPGLNEGEIPELLERAHQAGARTAVAALLRLSGSVQPVFLERMKEAFPDRIAKIIGRLREVRGGALPCRVRRRQ